MTMDKLAYRMTTDEVIEARRQKLLSLIKRLEDLDTKTLEELVVVKRELEAFDMRIDALNAEREKIKK